MHVLLRTFWELITLRREPHTLPYSRTLMQLAILVHLCTGSLMAFFGSEDPLQGFLAAAISTSVLYLFCYAVLLLYRLPQRMTQTVTAFAGGEVLLGLIMVPLILLLQHLQEMTMAALMSLVLLIWNMLFAGYVMRLAVDKTTQTGIQLGLLYMITSMAIGIVLSPQ